MNNISGTTTLHHITQLYCSKATMSAEKLQCSQCDDHVRMQLSLSFNSIHSENHLSSKSHPCKGFLDLLVQLLEGDLYQMFSPVHDHVNLLHETLPANVAGEWPLSGVRPLVVG